MVGIPQGCIRIHGEQDHIIDLHTHPVGQVIPGPGELVVVSKNYDPPEGWRTEINIYSGVPSFTFTDDNVTVYDRCTPQI